MSLKTINKEKLQAKSQSQSRQSRTDACIAAHAGRYGCLPVAGLADKHSMDNRRRRIALDDDLDCHMMNDIALRKVSDSISCSCKYVHIPTMRAVGSFQETSSSIRLMPYLGLQDDLLEVVVVVRCVCRCFSPHCPMPVPMSSGMWSAEWWRCF